MRVVFCIWCSLEVLTPAGRADRSPRYSSVRRATEHTESVSIIAYGPHASLRNIFPSRAEWCSLLASDSVC